MPSCSTFSMGFGAAWGGVWQDSRAVARDAQPLAPSTTPLGWRRAP